VINRAGLRYSEHHVTMKKAGRAPAIVASRPQDFMAKLAALVPAPRLHLTRFHEILAPAAKWRPLIVPNAATFQRRNYFVFGASAAGYGYQVHCKKCGNEASLQHDPAMRKMTVSCKHCNIAASFKRSVIFTVNNSKLGPAVFLRAARHKEEGNES